MAQVLGQNQLLEVDVTGAGTTYKTMVCLSTSSVSVDMQTSDEYTNCGLLTATSPIKVTFSFDAVCETAPSVSQVSYQSLLDAMAASTLIKIRFQNPAVTGSSIGTAYKHECSAYITKLDMKQSSKELIKFTGTITSTGTPTLV